MPRRRSAVSALKRAIDSSQVETCERPSKLAGIATEARYAAKSFKRTGTSHHLAISGMHVAVLGIFVYGVCKLLRLRPRVAAVVAMTALPARSAGTSLLVGTSWRITSRFVT